MTYHLNVLYCFKDSDNLEYELHSERLDGHGPSLWNFIREQMQNQLKPHVANPPEILRIQSNEYQLGLGVSSKLKNVPYNNLTNAEKVAFYELANDIAFYGKTMAVWVKIQ